MREKLSYLLDLNKTSLLYQSTFSFVVGLVFSPFSTGFIYFISYLIAYEIIYLIYAYRKNCSYQPVERAYIIILALIGFAAGRTLVSRQEIFKSKYTNYHETENGLVEITERSNDLVKDHLEKAKTGYLTFRPRYRQF